MADAVSTQVRSKIMRAIVSSKTGPENLLIKAFASCGLKGWRTQASTLPGTPDFIFRSQKLAIFVDGCFWHGCLSCYRRPHSHKLYWREKLRSNMARDQKNSMDLIEKGWGVLRLWEHEIRQHPADCLGLIKKALERKQLARKVLRLLVSKSNRLSHGTK